MMGAAEISRALGGKASKKGYAIRCPALGHGRGRGDKKRSCTIRDGDVPGRVLVKCFAGCSSDAILEGLRSAKLLDDAAPRDGAAHPHLVRSQEPREEPSPDPEALRIWIAGRALMRTPAETYLREHRALTGELPPSLRFGYAKRFATGSEFPALIAAIARPTDRKIIAVQVTFLTESGQKTPTATPRLTFGALGTGAIRLAPCSDVLGLAEGVETALSAMELTGIPCWSSVGNWRLHSLTVPDSVKTVHIFGDNDDPGCMAAERAAERHTREGRKVYVRFPPQGFGDYNDVLRARASQVAA